MFVLLARAVSKMKFIPMQLYDLTKTDATTVLAYRNNVTVSTEIISGNYPNNIATEAFK